MVFFLRFLVVLLGIVLRPFRRQWKKGAPVRCLLVGYGGANNTGAEVHTDEAVRQMRAAVGERLDITVTSLDRMRSLRYMTEDDHLRIVTIPSFFIFSLARHVLRSDVVVLVEGYCFMQDFSQVLFWFFMFAADLAQCLRIPTVAYAVDAGNLFPVNRRWAARVAGRVDLLMMRTEAAAGIMRDLGVKREVVVTTDTAFAIVPESDAWAKHKFREVGFDPTRPVLAIAFEEFFWWPVVPRLGKWITRQREGLYKAFYYHTWSPERYARSDAMKQAVATFADWAGREFQMEIALFAMDRVNHDPCADVIRLMSRPAVMFDADRYDGRQMTALLRNCKLLVASEYHALLLSMGAGVPVIGLGHDERIQSVMDELEMKDEYYIHYTEHDIESRLKNKSSLILAEEEIVRRHILDAVQTYLKRAAMNGEHFAKLIDTKFPV